MLTHSEQGSCSVDCAGTLRNEEIQEIRKMSEERQQLEDYRLVSRNCQALPSYNKKNTMENTQVKIYSTALRSHERPLKGMENTR